MSRKVTYKLVKRTYLTLTSLPEKELMTNPGNVEVVKAHNPTAAFYLFLYTEVGREFGWADRLLKTTDELLAIIRNPRVDIYVIYVAGVPAGYAEIDRSNPDEYFLVFFGLMPEFRGQGLGKYFLRWVIRKAFEGNPKRLSLDTMDQDHPHALPNYLKAGFKIVDQRMEKQSVIVDDEAVS